MWCRRLVRCAALALASGLGDMAQAQDADAACGGPGRAILALYDSRQDPDPRLGRIHRYAEMPLNHLGYRLFYRDIASGLPDPAALSALLDGQRLAALMSWFDGPLADWATFATWAEAARDGCGQPPKAVVLGNTGRPLTIDPGGAGTAYLARAGIVAGGGEVSLGVTARILHADPVADGGEQPFILAPGLYADVDARDGAQSLLRAGTTRAAIDLAVFAETGAYAHTDALVAEDGYGHAFWRLDPFTFFAAALGNAPQPVPDTTTRNGRRIYFSTVKGEGWAELLPRERLGEEEQIAGEVVADQFVTPFPGLPVTVAVATVQIELDGTEGHSGRVREALRGLAQRPGVEIGSLGRSVVLRWAALAPGAGQQVKSTGATGTDSGAGAVRQTITRLIGIATGAADTSGTDRQDTAEPFMLAVEVDGAAATVMELARTARPPVLLWSGDARPFAAVLARARDAGLPAMGGGGGGLAALAPSLTTLGPLTAPVEDEVQVLDALADERFYGGTAPQTGFAGLAATLAGTESPRRIKPFHLNYTARVVQTFAGRMAVTAQLEAAAAADLSPVTARDYSGIVSGWMQFRAVPVAELAWRIDDRGAVQTLRVDNAAALSLDPVASTGVLGARRHGAALYIALDPAASRPVVALAAEGAASGVAGPVGAPMLAQTGADTAAMTRAGCATTVRLGGLRGGMAQWWGDPASRVTVSWDGAAIHGTTVLADAQGLITTPLPDLDGGDAMLVLTADCLEN